MTRDELKTILASKENKLAKRAIEVIRACGPVEELQSLIDQGCAKRYIERDPAHPRSRFKETDVLAACFETSFGIVSEKTEEAEGHKVHTAVIGEVHQSSGREAHFKLLLERGFTAGENGYRGAFFPHILNSCFYAHEGPERQASGRRFAKILVESGRYDIQHYAKNNYGWIGHPEHAKFMISLGANPQGSDMIDCALNYVGCSPNGNCTHQDRIEVVKLLLDLGATPAKDLRRAISWQHIRARLEEADLIGRLAPFGVIDAERSQEYTDYLARVATYA